MINPTLRVTTLAALTSGTDITEEICDAEGSVPHNHEGRKSFTLPFGTVLPGTPLDDGVVQVLFDGTVADAMLLEAEQTIEVAEGEEPGMPTIYNGRGLAGLLDRYPFRPQLGYNRQPYSDRVSFSAFHSAYADHLSSPWEDAIEIADVGGVSARYTGLPNGYPHFEGVWIGVPGTDDLEAPVGRWWWLDDVTFPEDQLVAWFTAGDNRYRLFAGGLQVAEVSNDRDTHSGFAESHLTILFFTAGTYRIGGLVVNPDSTNEDPPDGEGAVITGNPTAFTGHMRDIDGRGALGAVLWETSTDARVLGFPDNPPGMTIPEILAVVLDEADDDGVDPLFTLADHGSFDEIETVTVDRKDNLLKVLRDDWADIYCDWHVPPDALELHVWPPGDRGSASGVTYETDDDPNAANLLYLESAKLDDGTDYLIVDWLGGPPFRHPSSGGTRPGRLSTKATSRREAELVATYVLSQPDQPEQVKVRIAPAGGDVPGVDLDNGDTCATGSHSGQRVLEWSWSIQDDFAGEPTFGLIVNHLIPTDESRIGKRVRALTGSDQGAQAPATAVLPPDRFGSTIRSSDVTFRPLPPYVPGPADVEKRPVGSGNIYAVAVTAKTAGSSNTEFEFLVNGTDILAGAGVLPTGSLFALIPVDTPGVIYVDGNGSRMTVDLTTVGSGVDGLLFEPRFVLGS